MVMYAIGYPGGEARICEFPDPDDLEAKVRPGEVAVEIERFFAGRLSEDGTAYLPHVPDLAERKTERWVAAKAVRRKRIGQGVLIDDVGLVQTDAGPGRDSLAAIERLAGRALRNPDASILLTLADNSSATLSAAAMLAVADAVAAHEQACRDAADAIRALIEAAEDEAALDAIDITAGYPALPEG